MRGKIVNLCAGIVNILYGILIVLYTEYVKQDKTLLTIQETTVVSYLIKAIYLIMFVVVVTNVIQSLNHKDDTTFNVTYMAGILAILFLYFKNPIIGVINIFIGIIVSLKSFNENLVEINSTTAISASLVIMAAILALGVVTLKYQDIGQYIKNKDNKNETTYTEDFFKYITELGIDEPYINVKKDGKFGYIDTNGQTKIDFLYDYASPFVNISVYDKTFQIALVCIDGSSKIIMKNGRIVMSYRTESNDNNYGAKIKELEDIYRNTLKQSGDMTFEIENRVSNIKTISRVETTDQDNIYTYDYNDEFYIVVTRSNMGYNDTYELVKKDNNLERLTLDTTNLCYDEKYLYLFSNGTIPFYEINDGYQGWFTSYGKKNTMKGKAQILDFFSDKILLRNYSKTSSNTIYFFKSTPEEPVSENYSDIYVCKNGRYIVRMQQDGYFKIIDNNFNNIFGETEFAVVNPRLTNSNLYLVTNDTDDIKFDDFGYAKINWSLVNDNGQVIMDNIEQIYDVYYQNSTNKELDEDNYLEFLENLKALNYKFVGDDFYSKYR